MSGELIYGPVTIFVAPADTPIPETPVEALDPGGPWELLHPTCPDVLPTDSASKGGTDTA